MDFVDISANYLDFGMRMSCMQDIMSVDKVVDFSDMNVSGEEFLACIMWM